MVTLILLNAQNHWISTVKVMVLGFAVTLKLVSSVTQILLLLLMGGNRVLFFFRHGTIA